MTVFKYLHHYLGYTVLAWSLVVSGCSLSGEPVPEDHYYRLPAVQVPQRQSHMVDEIVLQPVQVSGLYHERAMLYVEQGSPLEIHRYHYHYWAESPAFLLTRYIGNWLKGSGVAQTVRVGRAGDHPTVEIIPTLTRFERIITDDGPENRIEVAFQVQGAAITNGSETYRVQLPAVSTSMQDSAAAFGQALDRLMAQFVEDLVQKIR